MRCDARHPEVIGGDDAGDEGAMEVEILHKRLGCNKRYAGSQVVPADEINVRRADASVKNSNSDYRIALLNVPRIWCHNLSHVPLIIIKEVRVGGIVEGLRTSLYFDALNYLIQGRNPPHLQVASNAFYVPGPDKRFGCFISQTADFGHANLRVSTLNRATLCFNLPDQLRHRTFELDDEVIRLANVSS